MSSTLYIVPAEHALDAFEWRGAVTFKLPVKTVFGRVLCDTDGSIGYPTEFSPETALQIIDQCQEITDRLAPEDLKDLAKIKKWAEQGKRLYADWQH